MSFILIGSLFIILCNHVLGKPCPTNYVEITSGCYRILNGSYLTWPNARQTCFDDWSQAPNETTPNSTHLIALEQVTEYTALVYWMKAYAIETEFWIDGIFSTATWSWSNQSITWYFSSDEEMVIGNGSNYKLTYNVNKTIYQIADDIGTKQLNYICEYQKPCNGSNPCQNDATCYLNVGRESCICSSGFTGQYCDTDIDECLSSPCQHGGLCIDGRNNYSCDCSDLFFTGPNCEIEKADPTQSQRSAAFWSVVGVIAGLVVILTLSDLPWDDIINTLGCSFYRFQCHSKPNNDEKIVDKKLHLSDSSLDALNSQIKNKSTSDGRIISNGMNYHVTDAVWNPEYSCNQTSSNSTDDAHHRIDQTRTPDDALIQSFALATIEKQRQKELEDKRIYAVNMNEFTSSPSENKDPVDTMITWTEQLQDQLKNKTSRETSVCSTKQLIHSSNTSDC